MQIDRNRIQEGTLGRIAFIGVVVFAVICTAAQFLRMDLDWIEDPLSFYLIGPGGWIVKSAYVALSLSLVAVGQGFHRGLEPGVRSRVPLALFTLSGIALTVTALSDTAVYHAGMHVHLIDAGVHHGNVALHTHIHRIAAATTFVCVTAAMLLQSARLREDPRWRHASAFAFVLAAVAFASLCIYAGSHLLPKGLMQKMVIVLILVWLGWASFALSRKGAP